MYQLHDRVTVVVRATRPWGLDVELPDGSTGFVDQSATKAWHQESPAHVVGETHDAVVLGPDRTPVRLSIRDVDIENAQRLDDGADPESQTQART